MNRKKANSKAVFHAIKSSLTLGDADEIHAIAQAIMEKFYGLTFTDVLLEKEIEIQDLSAITLRINQHEPLQYVLGEADFYGRKFSVNPSVLIPRPETELLVREVLLTENASRLLDIGTGSGCIAITLSLEWSGTGVYALDISEPALVTAKFNAARLGAGVNFIRANFLEEPLDIEPVDIIVSNPPYVLSSERASMSVNVLNHEPSIALFVPDDNPLLFYKEIASKSKYLLKPGGKVFVEINEKFGQETLALFDRAGYSSAKIVKDLDGKDRIVKAVI